MYASLQRLIDRHSHNFISGNIDAILPLYDSILPIYIAGNRLTLESRDEIAATLETHRRDVTQMGFTHVSGKLTAASVPRVGRFRAIVDWHYGHETGLPGPVGRTVYFCRQGTDGPIIEMMEYPALAFESACYWYADRLEHRLRTGT